MKDNIEDKYNEYLIDHLSNVKKAADWLMKNAVFSLFKDDYKDSIIRRLGMIGNDHDKSKYSIEEFKPYADHFYGNSHDKKEFNKAWHHHIINNPHHWNHWCFVDSTGNDNIVECVDIPIEYIIEMIADWWSFSWKSGNLYEIFDWYESHKDGIIVTFRTREYIELILGYIKGVLDSDKK